MTPDDDNFDPYLTPERVADRAELATRWVAYIKAGLRGERPRDELEETP